MAYTPPAYDEVDANLLSSYTPPAYDEVDADLLPAEIISGFTTWNPADAGVSVALSNGNLTADCTSNVNSSVRSIFGASSGKWYWEVELTGDGNATMVGIAYATADITYYPGAYAGSWGYYPFTGQIYTNGTAYNYGGSGTPTTGDIVSIALDMDNGTVEYYFNGVPKGIGITDLTGDVYALIGNGNFSVAGGIANFGASPFAYTVPVGFNPGFGIGDAPEPTPVVSDNARLRNNAILLAF